MRVYDLIKELQSLPEVSNVYFRSGERTFPVCGVSGELMTVDGDFIPKDFVTDYDDEPISFVAVLWDGDE